MSQITAPVAYAAIGSIIIDDIVDPCGRSTMGVLGGGGTHAVAGMRVWSRHTALVSVIGQGFPEAAWQRLLQLADTRAVLLRPGAQPRFWQLFEADGTRHELPRTDFALFQRSAVRPDEFPPEFASVRGVFLQTPTTETTLAWVARLRALNPAMVILWEPWEIYFRPENLAGLRQALPLVDVFSPQTAELGWLLGETGPRQQAAQLFEMGARCVALRLGAAGSLVGRAGQLHHLPAIAAPVVDETGAGNAYCGGFVVGYVESGGDAVTAGRYGAVSATFALAQVGVPLPGDHSRAAAETLLAQQKTPGG
ncbi:MAG: hypothetical protein Kow0031_16380 [Anaerolineae bacterium]